MCIFNKLTTDHVFDHILSYISDEFKTEELYNSVISNERI